MVADSDQWAAMSLGRCLLGLLPQCLHTLGHAIPKQVQLKQAQHSDGGDPEHRKSSWSKQRLGELWHIVCDDASHSDVAVDREHNPKEYIKDGRHSAQAL